MNATLKMWGPVIIIIVIEHTVKDSRNVRKCLLGVFRREPYSLTNKMFTALHRFSHVEMFVTLSPSCSIEGEQVLSTSQPYWE